MVDLETEGEGNWEKLIKGYKISVAQGEYDLEIKVVTIVNNCVVYLKFAEERS